MLGRFRRALAYRRYKLSEAIPQRIAWLLPKSVVKWAYIRVGAHATTGQYGSTVVPELTMTDALQRWDTA